jgi:hypothetical protein
MIPERAVVASSGRLLVALAVAFAGSMPAQAETTLAAYLGGGYSDNVGRTPSDEQGAGVYVVGGDLGWKRQGTRVTGTIAAGFDWYKYGSGAFNDEFLGHAIADLHLGLVPQRFLWVITENYGQAAADPLLPSTPANRQNVNVLSTGPDLKLRLGAVTTLTAAARYDDVQYEVSPTDYHGWSGQLALGRELSAATVVSLVAGRERVDYQDGTFPNYDRDQAYLQYTLNGSRTTLDAALGWSRIQSDAGSDDRPLLRLTLSRQVSALSTLSISGQYGLATGGEVFRSLQPAVLGTLPSQPDASIGDAARQSLVNVAWKTQWVRTRLDLGLTYGKEQYANATNRDVDRRGASVGLTHALTPLLDVTLAASRDRRDYTTLGRVFNDTDYGLTAQQKLGQSLSLVLELARNERTDTLGTNGYTENLAFLRLKWARDR